MLNLPMKYITKMRSNYAQILDQLKDGASKPTKVNDHVLIVDGLNNFIRAWSASPATNSDGVHIGGMIGFLQSVGLAVRTLLPTRVIIVFDGAGGSQRRRKIYGDYKGNRKPPKRPHRFQEMDNENDRESMSRQINRLAQYLLLLPVNTITIEKIEADDSIGYITTKLLKDSKISIMSSDKDFLQLVNDNVQVWSPTKKVLYDRTRVEEEFGMIPENMIYYRIVDGDKSDNIPGIRGFALKTILKKNPFLKNEKISNIEEYIQRSGFDGYDDLLRRNYALMQLDDVNISGNAKMKIMDIVNLLPHRLIKYKIHGLFLEDKINQAIRNPDVWLQDTFNRLDMVIENDTTSK